MTILFDLDGTLIDSTEAILESFHHAHDYFKLPHPDDKAIKSLIGHPLDVMFQRVGIKDEHLVEEMVAVYKKHYRKISTQKTVLLPYAKKAVEFASKHATLGIVTTKTGEYSKILMQHFCLMQHFDILIGREDVQNPKPHSEPIEKALHFLKADKGDCWMIGDTRMDLISARDAGVKSIAVVSEYEPIEELEKYTNIIKSNALEAVSEIVG